MSNPKISIDRGTKSYAVFLWDGLVGSFKSYTSEAAAIAEGKATLKRFTDEEPTVVYPRLKAIQITMPRSRKAIS